MVDTKDCSAFIVHLENKIKSVIKMELIVNEEHKYLN